MSDELKYLEIDAQAGLAEIDFDIGFDEKISLVFGDAGSGSIAVPIELGLNHNQAFYGDWGYEAYLHSKTPHAAIGEPQFNEWLDNNTTVIVDAPADGNTYVRIDNNWQIADVPDQGITDLFITPDPQFPVDYINYTLNGVDYTLTDIPKANGVIFGGYVSHIGGFTFGVGATAYYISGNLFTIQSGDITLDAADTTYSRIDIICVNDIGQIIKIKGVPSANPQKPTPNPLTEIELTQILVPANSLQPENITSITIYNENTEWLTSSTQMAVNFEDINAPFTGDVCINAGSLSNNSTLIFNQTATIPVFDFDVFVFSIKLKAPMSNQENLILTFYNGVNISSTPLIVELDKSLVGAWQIINLNINEIPFSSGNCNKVELKWNKQGPNTTHTGFYLDSMKFEKGILKSIEIPNDETDPVFIAWKDSIFGLGAKQTGVDEGILNQTSITDDYLYICVQGGDSSTAIWKKIVLFQT